VTVEKLVILTLENILKEAILVDKKVNIFIILRIVFVFRISRLKSQNYFTLNSSSGIFAGSISSFWNVHFLI
jgi:hypothetical protein